MEASESTSLEILSHPVAWKRVKCCFPCIGAFRNIWGLRTSGLRGARSSQNILHVTGSGFGYERALPMWSSLISHSFAVCPQFNFITFSNVPLNSGPVGSCLSAAVWCQRQSSGRQPASLDIHVSCPRSHSGPPSGSVCAPGYFARVPFSVPSEQVVHW